MSLINLGEVEVIRVEEMLWEVAPATLFPQLGAADFAPHMDWMAPRFFTADGLMRLSIQAFVVRTPHHTVVVDTCVGNDRERHHEAFTRLQTDFLRRLENQAGVSPGEVDYVLCTHLHSDHVGWNTHLVDGRWAPTFPNARYLFERSEFAYWTGLPEAKLPPAIADSVLPIAEAGLAELVEGAHAIGDSIRLEPTPGHTLGHYSVRIATPRGAAVITGDLLHLPAQVREPHWTTHVCHDPEQAIATRRGFIERHADAGTMVLGSHFPSPTACRFQRKNGGYVADFDG